MSTPTSIIGLNTTLNEETLHYLKSPNFGGIPDDSRNDDTTTCVVTPADEQTFTPSVFRANAFTDAAEFTTGQLDVYGRTASGEAVTYRPLAPAGLTASGLTRQSVNYTDLLHVPLESLNFTYRRGDDNLSFLMQLQGTCACSILALHLQKLTNLRHHFNFPNVRGNRAFAYPTCISCSWPDVLYYTLLSCVLEPEGREII